MSFPAIRMRRLRGRDTLRAMVQETRLTRFDFVMPLFVEENLAESTEIPSMPGQFRYTLDDLVRECRRLADLGVVAAILFGIPASKDAEGTGAWAEDGIVQRAMTAIRSAVPELYLIGDVCLCEYTSHGHCGVIKDETVDNDPTLEILARTALSQVRAGADMVAPSDMMDGRVGVIRGALDREGFAETPIMAYSAKYASSFYGPFRDAADSAPQFGDRRAYQMDPPNRREALREVALDIAEGADIVMVKPALAYLDIIREVRESCELPVAAYQVSGEYAMIKAAAERGWLEEQRVVLESLTAIKRAGADLILSYFTPQVIGWLSARE
jgi:porphobilinogen synthase